MRRLAPIISTIMILLTPGLVLAEEGQATCIGCKPIPSTPAEQPTAQVAPVEQVAPAATPAPATPLTRNAALHQQAGIYTAKILDYWVIGKACSKFANANGFGPYAKVIQDILTPATHPGLFAGTADLIKHCKSFPLFEDQQKKDFYSSM